MLIVAMLPSWPIAIVVSGGVSFALGFAAFWPSAIWSSGGRASTTVSAAEPLSTRL
jgi:hypothetical protein